MADIRITPATAFDFYYIADHLREIDRVEVSLAYGRPARDVIRGSAHGLSAQIVRFDGLPAILFGVALGNGPAAPWMVATDALYDMPQQFIADESAALVSGWLRDYGYLKNRVHRDNATSINWLRWLGFSIDTQPTGPESAFFDFWLGDARAAIVRASSVDEVCSAGNLGELLAGYADESSIADAGNINPNWTAYRAMEQAGIYQVSAAFLGGQLVGFAGVVLTDNPHYGRRLAVTESLFVEKAARKRGIGKQLLTHVERFASINRAAGLLVSAPFGGRLADVLPRSGYQQTNQIFFKALS